MFIPIIIATGVIAVLGLIVGVFLGFANKIFNVPTDEKVSQIRECLPGNNCGGCGYSGCDGLACAIAEGKAPVNACPVGGAEASKEISKIMGVETPNDVRKVAFVKCSGSCDKTQFVYQYFGTNNCHQVSLTPGRGSKACAYSCTGLGSCMNACSFDAIKIVNGRAQVMPDKCHGCGSCVSICPNHLIELIPANALYVVRCFSQEKGKKVRDMCAVGCVGCGVCAKVCPSGAITLENNIAHIDQTKCVGCGKCAAKCPSHIIIDRKELVAIENAKSMQDET